MKQYSDYDDFTEIIRELAREEVKNILKEEGFCRTMTGQVIDTDNKGGYSVDLVDTVVNNIINKSGESLNLGDTVTLTEKYGSNYSNCYISVKNASRNSPTVDEFKNKQNDILERLAVLESKSFIEYNNLEVNSNKDILIIKDPTDNKKGIKIYNKNGSLEIDIV